MALPDLTGQPIEDSYQRLLQVSGSGDIVDGTGSLFIPPNAISASYATSASYEIIKEVSSSHANFSDTASLAYSANTASYVNPLQQDLLLTGSLKTSGSVDISLPAGSALTITETDMAQSGRFDFQFEQGDPILEIAGRFSTASLSLKTDLAGHEFLLTSDGIIRRRIQGDPTTYGVEFTSQFKPIDTQGNVDLGYFNRRWGNLWLNNGDKISFGPSASPNEDKVSIRHTAGTSKLTITGSSDVTLDVKGTLSVNGSSRTLFTSASMVYSGDKVTQVTQSYEAGTQQITDIVYTGDNPQTIAITGSDGINKLYTIVYDGDNVSEIRVT